VSLGRAPLIAGCWRLEAGGWRLEAGGWKLEADSSFQVKPHRIDPSHERKGKQ